MSFFYLSPVKGDMQIHLLETIVLKRLEFLKNQNNNLYNEYVIEGSVYDVVGHFVLCIISNLNKSEFSSFFLKAEEALFTNRLKVLSAYDLRCFARRLLRSIRKLSSFPTHLEPLLHLCQHLCLRDIAHHISNTCISGCSVHCLKLNFKYCLSLLAKRQVDLKNGFAYIPCSKWKQYLILLFSINLKYRIFNINLDALKHDPRIIELQRRVRNEMVSLYNNSKFKILRSLDVDHSSFMFPPCMKNLHQHLRSKHRLTHDYRFYYSLFLKDIGMPVEEALKFWKAEYCQAPSGKHNCCHNWQKDEKKFVYGIRHIYGLEGGRKLYSSGNCQRIQGSQAACSEGGCPFKSFDHDRMQKVLNLETTNPILSQIIKFKEKKQYTTACLYYLQKSLLDVPFNNCDNLISFNFSPVKYYEITTKKNKTL